VPDHRRHSRRGRLPRPGPDDTDRARDHGSLERLRAPRQGARQEAPDEILTLTIPGPGIVNAAQADTPGERTSARKPLVKPVRVTAGKASKVTLPIRPSKAGRKRLRKTRSFSVRLKVTYTPNGGEPRNTTRRVKINDEVAIRCGRRPRESLTLGRP